MDTNEASTTVKPPFFELPLELRLMIYQMLLTRRYSHWEGQLKLHTAILRCNRQVYEEAKEVLYSDNIWIVAKVDARYLPSLVEPVEPMRQISQEDADAIRYPALRIDLTMPLAENAPPQAHMNFFMREDNIPNFLQYLWHLSGDRKTEQDFRKMSLSLTLCETPFHAKSKLQSRCLEPFGLLHGLQNLSIRGQVDPAYVEKILDCAKNGAADRQHVERMTNFRLEQGNKAYFAGGLTRAYMEYVHGSAYLLNVLVSRARGVFTVSATTEEHHFVMRLEYKLEARILRVTLQWGMCEQVKKWGTRLLNLREFPDEERVQTMLCVARAHRALGERRQESRLLIEALQAMSDKSNFIAALKVLFIGAPLEFIRLLDKQERKARQGAIDLYVIKTVWEFCGRLCELGERYYTGCRDVSLPGCLPWPPT